ncbi:MULTISPECIES: LCI fold-containing protein [Xenorhabdus]|uniref:LCI fold-containing protein n=1 Tax=Xenorhabdus TaxID=626 RepID=UPI00069C65E9|nr:MULTISPECIES: LCI fold-containing protein [Xenorhabdus]
MFKKLLTVGALAAALIGGVGTASAFDKCPSQATTDNGRVYLRYVVNPYNSFANTFKSDGITWYYQGPSFQCSYNGTVAWAAQYKGN